MHGLDSNHGPLGYEPSTHLRKLKSDKESNIFKNIDAFCDHLLSIKEKQCSSLGVHQNYA